MKMYSNYSGTLVIFYLLVSNIAMSSAILYIVRKQNCVRGEVFTPPPAATSNICLQCICLMGEVAYCKPLYVKLSVICSAAIGNVVVVQPAATIVAAPITIPAATAITSIGINPRASTSAPVPMLMSGSVMATVTVAPATTAPATTLAAAGR